MVMVCFELMEPQPVLARHAHEHPAAKASMHMLELHSNMCEVLPN